MTLQTTIDALKANNDALDADVTTAESGNAQTRTDFETAKADTDQYLVDASNALTSATGHKQQAQQAEMVAADVAADTLAAKDSAVAGVAQTGTVATAAEGVVVSAQVLATADKAKAIARVYGQPSLELDFVNQRYTVQSPVAPWLRDDLDPALDLTFTRASTKWVFDSTGTLVEVPVDTMAIDHDPVTGESLGVLLEGAGTNLFTYSEDWATGFDANGITPVSAGAINGLDFWLLEQPSAATENNRIWRGSPVTTNPTEVTISFFVAPVSGSTDLLEFALVANWIPTVKFSIDPNTGETVLLAGTVSYKVESVGFGYRVSVTTTKNADGSSAYITFAVINPSGTLFGGGTGGVYATGLQLEESPYPTSYIPTNGAAVTRAADSLVRLFSAEQAVNGTVFYDGVPHVNLDNTYPDDFYPLGLGPRGNYNNPRIIRQGVYNRWLAYSGGGGSSLIILTEGAQYWAPGEQAILALSWAGLPLGGVKTTFAFDGHTGSREDASISWPISGFYVGDYAPQHVRRLTLYPRALTEAELIDLTTLPV